MENDKELLYEASDTRITEEPADVSGSFTDIQQSHLDLLKMVCDKLTPSRIAERFYEAFIPPSRPGFPSELGLDPLAFWTRLGQRDLDYDCIKRETWQDPNLEDASSALAAVALIMGKVYESKYKKVFLDGWRHILSRVFDLGGLEQLDCMSPLSLFVLESCSNVFALSQEQVHEKVNMRVDELRLAGVKDEELRKYFRFEKRCLCQKGSRNNWDFAWDNYRYWAQAYTEPERIHVISLQTKLSTNTWQLWVSWPTDEYVGELWEMVESAEAFVARCGAEDSQIDMPGAWQGQKSHQCWASFHDHHFTLRKWRRNRNISKGRAKRTLRQIAFFHFQKEEYLCCDRAEGEVYLLLHYARRYTP